MLPVTTARCIGNSPMKNLAKKGGKPPKGNAIPDSKPDNDYKRGAKKAKKARALGKK